MKKVGLIMGSDSDWPVLESGVALLKEFGIPVDVQVASAHRTPELVKQFVEEAPSRGIAVIIAAAGAAAHLPGVIAGYTTLPVIGVPIASTSLQGMDALLSIAQMPPGIPVGTMAVDGGKNAALYAASILAWSDVKIHEALQKFRNEQAEQVAKKHEALQAKIDK